MLEGSLRKRALKYDCQIYHDKKKGSHSCRNKQHIATVFRILSNCQNEDEAAALLKNSCALFATCEFQSSSSFNMAISRGWLKLASWMLVLGLNFDQVASQAFLVAIHSMRMGSALFLLAEGLDIWRINRTILEHLVDTSHKTIHKGLHLLKHEQEYVRNEYFDCFNQKICSMYLQVKVCMVWNRLLSKKNVCHSYTHSDNIEDIVINEEQLNSFKNRFRTIRDFNRTLVRSFTSPSEADKMLCERFDMTPTFTLKEMRALSDMEQQSESVSLNHQHNSVLVFGTNDNYNLGQGSCKSYSEPSLLEQLSHISDNCVVDVSMSKYHTLFLMNSGNVKACGNGAGGRLGTGSTASSIKPENVQTPSGLKIKAISTGINHSLFLTHCNKVLVCGYNQHHILGIDKKDSKGTTYLTPQTVSWRENPEKLTDNVNILSSDFHCMVWTKESITTWGKNNGQMGFKDEEHVLEPTKLSLKFYRGDKSAIQLVSSNEVATAFVTLRGDVYVINDHTFHRVLTECSGITQIQIIVSPPETSSRLQCHADTNKNNYLNTFLKYSDQSKNFFLDYLLLYLLHDGEIILLSATSGLKEKVDLPGHNWKSFTASTSHLVAITDHDCVHEITLVPSQSGRHTGKKVFLPQLFRGSKVICDPNGDNFVVLSSDAIQISCDFKLVNTMREDFGNLLTNCFVDDGYVDILLKSSNGKLFTAHKLILAANSNYFRNLFSLGESFGEVSKCDNCKSPNLEFSGNETSLPSLTPQKEIQLVSLDCIESEVLEEVLYFIYTGVFKKINFPQASEEETPLDEVFFHEVCRVCMLLGINVDLNVTSNVCQKLQIDSLVKVQPDVVFLCKDDEQVDDTSPVAHKLILVARNEYFSIMFTGRWDSGVGSKLEDGRHLLNMDKYSRTAIRMLLQFLYSDDVCLCNSSLGYIQEFLFLANELLCKKAQILAEIAIAKRINLGNFAYLKKMTALFDAQILKYMLHIFVIRNLPFIVSSIKDYSDFSLADFYQCDEFVKSVLQIEPKDIYYCSVNHSSSKADTIFYDCGPKYRVPGMDTKELNVELDNYLEAGSTYFNLNPYIRKTLKDLFNFDESYLDPMSCVKESNKELYNDIMKSLVIDDPQSPLRKYGASRPIRRRKSSRRYNSQSSDSSDTEINTDIQLEKFDFSGLEDKYDSHDHSDDSLEMNKMDHDDVENMADENWHLVSRKASNFNNVRKVIMKPDNLEVARTEIHALKLSETRISEKEPPADSVKKRSRRKSNGQSECDVIPRMTSVDYHIEDTKSSPSICKIVNDSPYGDIKEMADNSVIQSLDMKKAERSDEKRIELNFPALGASPSTASVTPKSRYTPKQKFQRTSQKERQRRSTDVPNAEIKKRATPAWNIPTDLPIDVESDNLSESCQKLSISANDLEPVSFPALNRTNSVPDEHSLTNIMREQKTLHHHKELTQKKGFCLIQKEDKAISELERHYRALGTPGDEIIITRIAVKDDFTSIEESNWTGGKKLRINN